MTLEQLYTTHKDLVFNLALQYTQSIEDAEEVTQDVFVSVHKNLLKFKSESTIKTWIYRITINKSLDYLKAKKRKKRWAMFNSSGLDNSELENKHVHFHHPEIAMEQQEALQKVLDCIQQLPNNQKTVVLLLKIEHKTKEEVAEIMKTTPKAVESLFNRAKKKLKEYLEQTKEKE